MKYRQVGACLWEHIGNTVLPPKRGNCWAKLEIIVCGLSRVALGGRLLGLMVQMNGVIQCLREFKDKYSEG